MNVNYDELIMLPGGAFLAVWGFAKMNERTKLLANGVKVEGIVFELYTELVYNRESEPGKMNYPIIRFVTTEKEWASKTYKMGSNPPAYEVGDKVKVVYDTADIEHFIIDDWGSMLTWPIVASVGVLLILGVVVYFFTMQFQGF
ncbi:MAG: DUF3592 domain-containing protein [Bacteroidota bacterium]